MKTITTWLKTVVVGAAAASLGAASIGCNVNTGEQCVGTAANCSKTTGDAGTGGGTGGEAKESKDPSKVPDTGITAVTGKVLNSLNGEPIALAVVTTDPPTGQVLTNTQGQYVLDATDFPGMKEGLSMRINVTRSGYLPNSANVTLTKNKVSAADILMEKSANDFNVKVSPSLIDLGDKDFKAGSTTVTKDITIQLDGTKAAADTAAYTISIPSEDKDWISVDKPTGTVTGSPKFISATINKAGLAAGSYSGTIRVVVDGASGIEEIQVKLTVGGGGGTTGTTDAGGTTGTTDAGGGTGADTSSSGSTDDAGAAPDA